MKSPTDERLRKRAAHDTAVDRGLHRGDMWLTLVYDGGILMTAVAIRAAFLWVLSYASPPGTENWAIAALSWVADVGLVATAVVVTAFDVLKRVIIAGKSLLKTLRE